MTFSDDGTARQWDANDGSPTTPPMKHNDEVKGAFFNKKETQILTWSGNILSTKGRVQLWDANDGSPIGKPIKHDRHIFGAIFNKDETRILTFSDDGTACLLNIEFDEDFSKEHLPLMVKVATGTIMDDYGSVTTMSKKKWEEYKAYYILIAEEHLVSCKYKSKNIYLNHQKSNWAKN